MNDEHIGRQQANLITTETFAAILLVSKRQIFKLNNSGMIPAPVRIGGSVRWNSHEIDLWINSGCPDRQTWEALKIQSKQTGGRL